jgi:hypothetical protein
MPTLQPLATVEQLGILLKTDLPADDPTAVMLLGWASGLVRGYLGQDITRVENDVALVSPQNGYVILEQLPVVSVQLVEVNDRYDTDIWTPLDPAEYRVDLTRGRIRGTGYGSYYGYPSWPYHWPVHPDSFRVTYTHGLEEVPHEIAGVTASIAARIHNMPPGILNERNGQRGATFRPEDALTPIEKLTLGSIREARIA